MISPLDKRIAELKGMKDPDKLEGLEVVALIGGDYSWSTSDAMAMNLVDEITVPLFFIERYGKPGEKTWKAHFAFPQRLTYFDKGRDATVSYPDAPKDIIGEGPTRPEAICRAWIAAMEWLKEKKE